MTNNAMPQPPNVIEMANTHDFDFNSNPEQAISQQESFYNGRCLNYTNSQRKDCCVVCVSTGAIVAGTVGLAVISKIFSEVREINEWETSLFYLGFISGSVSVITGCILLGCLVNDRFGGTRVQNSPSARPPKVDYAVVKS